MTSSDPKRTTGYRGALSTREDRLARPWVLTVLGTFALILVLSFLGIPSRLVPDPTPVPLPSLPAPSASGSFAPVESLPAESLLPSGSDASSE